MTEITKKYRSKKKDEMQVEKREAGICKREQMRQ